MHHIRAVGKGLLAGADLHNVQAIGSIAQNGAIVCMVLPCSIDGKSIQCSGGRIISIGRRLNRTRVHKCIGVTTNARHMCILSTDSKPRATVTIAPQVNHHIPGGIVMSQTHMLGRAIIIHLLHNQRAAERIITR